MKKKSLHKFKQGDIVEVVWKDHNTQTEWEGEETIVITKSVGYFINSGQEVFSICQSIETNNHDKKAEVLNILKSGIMSVRLVA